MYVLPRGLESAWKVASGKGFVLGPKKYGEALVSGTPRMWPSSSSDRLPALCDWNGDGHGTFNLAI